MKIKVNLVILVSLFLTACEKDKYLLSNLEFKVYETYLPSQNTKVEKLDRVVNLTTQGEATLYLEVDGVREHQVLKVWYEMYTLKGTYIDRLNFENITRKNLVVPITFRDIGKGDYKVRIYARSKDMDAPLLMLFDVKVYGTDGGNVDDGNTGGNQQFSWNCYFNGVSAPSTIYLHSSIQNTYLEVRASVPDNSFVYYKWSDEVRYGTEPFHSENAYIVLPYLKGKTRTLEIWLNGHPSKCFTVISQ